MHQLINQVVEGVTRPFDFFRRSLLFCYGNLSMMSFTSMSGSWITLPTDALRIYFNLCIIKYFLNIISPNNDMKAKVDALLAAYPSIDITAMGFL